MTFVALEADSCDEAGLEGKEADGEAALTGDCADLTNGGTIEIGTCYTLIFDQDVDTSTWTIEVDHRRRRLEDHDHSCVAMYTQHVPIEFEEDTHYLQLDGEDVEPIAEEGADGHAHDHGGGEAYEWAGTFELEHGESYTWIAQKVDGDYADETMTIVAMEVAGGTQADLELVVDEAAALLEGDCEDVAFGGSIGFGACYKLVFQQDISTSLYYVPVPAERRLEDHDHGDADMGYFAFFTQHVPVEFVDTSHYLKDDHGEDIKPTAELATPRPTPRPTPLPTPNPQPAPVSNPQPTSLPTPRPTTSSGGRGRRGRRRGCHRLRLHHAPPVQGRRGSRGLQRRGA